MKTMTTARPVRAREGSSAGARQLGQPTGLHITAQPAKAGFVAPRVTAPRRP
jgi:hypothetical protein